MRIYFLIENIYLVV
jgi:serine/threonine protein kinase